MELDLADMRRVAEEAVTRRVSVGLNPLTMLAILDRLDAAERTLRYLGATRDSGLGTRD